MGCCVSTNRSSHSASSPTKDNDPVTSSKPAPSPLPHEEETVKKVLSETLKSEKPPSPKNPTTTTTTFDELEREIKNEKKNKALNTIINKAEEEISQVSEVCSLSETMSTTTLTDTREEQLQTEKTLKRVNKSPARTQKNRTFSSDLAGNRERVVGKSPARNGGSVRVVNGRDQMGNGGIGNIHRRRHSGEISCRRSRSPATRTDSVGRSPSARRRTNQSPARNRTAAAETGGRKIENSMVERKWSSSNESLENPLVSLECFIFL